MGRPVKVYFDPPTFSGMKGSKLLQVLLCRGHDLVKMMPGESILKEIGANWRLSPLFCAVQTPFSLFCGSNSIVTHFFVCEGQLSPFFLL